MVSYGLVMEYQAFIRFGQPEYNSRIESYLKSDAGGNAPNRIREAKPEMLLRYNGMDSLLEFMVAKDQAREMGVVL